MTNSKFLPNMFFPPAALGLVCLLLSGGLSDPAQATSYTFTTISVPGVAATQIYGINNSGEIVGYYRETGTSSYQGFLDNAGSFTTLDFPGASSTQALGINDSGQIVGEYDNGSGTHAFLYSTGSFSTIVVPGSTFSSANGVNNSGQIVGSSSGGGFLDTAGSFTTISVPGSDKTQPQDVNSAGQITGFYNNPGANGFSYTAGTYKTINDPAEQGTHALGINDSGQIVGSFSPGTVAGSDDSGFIYTAGTFATVNAPKARSTSVNDINNTGEIAGSIDVGGVTKGFIATPIAGGSGDPHLTTFDGHDYSFQAVGDFLLTRSTVAGDSFDVQVRNTSWSAGSALAKISEIAAQLGSHRVTFDLDRASDGGSFLWVDGRPTTLNAAKAVLTLDGGRILELSSNQFRVTWDTGEVMIVTNVGTYLDITFPNPPPGGAGSVEGLLGSDTGWDDDFRLADGMLLDPLTSTSVLDEAFADSWRVIGAASLFGPANVSEPATLTLLSLALGLTGMALMRRRVTGLGQA